MQTGEEGRDGGWDVCTLERRVARAGRDRQWAGDRLALACLSPARLQKKWQLLQGVLIVVAN